ncbi:interleukin-1 receptor-associated kinase 1 isoform X1 [Synchiropus splendidus]|uniref:interleukin-1 receptor-associated kinase 1 isoform X1 n=2 Tax=Synchiropus splendidus TaxID=270530 RepID=UPI00237E53FE|nr:interleukin-1 receptor-associated kinase 1 isoform X1 [Synchiropus splendidus]
MTSDVRGEFLYNLPAPVLFDFCRIMDSLSASDWVRFASEVLKDSTDVRLAEKKERRTDLVMTQWENRNGRVGDLLDVLDRLQLLRPRDIILNWASSPRTCSSSSHQPPISSSPQQSTFKFTTPSSSSETCAWVGGSSHAGDEGGGRPLPKPAPPPSSLLSRPKAKSCPPDTCDERNGGVMRWSYEEVHAGTEGFSPAQQIGEGGFGVVYRAWLGSTDCAVKKLKQDQLLDFDVLRQSFQTEVDQLSKFRHPNIIALLGFCEGPGIFCLIYSFMENLSLKDHLHCVIPLRHTHGCGIISCSNCPANACVMQVSGALSWSQRVSIVKDTSAALHFLHSPPNKAASLIHGDIKSSNILLDRHLVAKLGDFGLARFAKSTSERSASKTTSVGRTTTVRGTLAYLPDEYVRNQELSTAVDVFSFGVVLLEILTGRLAVEEKQTSNLYLKDLVDEEESTDSSFWKQQLDHRLMAGGAAEPAGSLETAALACRCLDRKRKKRPQMSEVFSRLQDVYQLLPVRDSTVDCLSAQLSHVSTHSVTASHTPPKTLQSCAPSSLSQPTSLPPSSSSSLLGPCETDESRGFSQYHRSFPCSRSLPTSTTTLSLPGPRSDPYVRTGPGPREETFSSSSPGAMLPDASGLRREAESWRSAAVSGPEESRGPEESLEPQESLEIRNPEQHRGPEESDELDYLHQSEH